MILSRLMNNQKSYKQLIPISSFIYRLYLIVLSVTILSTQSNIWNWNDYFVCEIIYLVAILLCYNARTTEVRSIFDFILINITLWGKGVFQPVNYFFVILPLISSVFYTGRHRSIFSILLLTYITIFINAFSCNRVSILIPPLLLYFLCTLYESRRRWLSYSQDLNTEIDKSFCDREIIRKPHKLFPLIIHQLNSFTNRQYITRISVYIIKGNDSIFLINASHFLWDRQLYLQLDEINHLRNSKTLTKSVDIKNDEHAERYYYVKINDDEYIVRYDTTTNFKLYILLKIGLSNLLMGLSSKIARILDLRYKVIQQKDSDIAEARKSKDYIDKAIGVMHFIRNKLNPIVNVLDYEVADDRIKNSVSEKLYKKTLKVALHDVDDIKNRANYLLDPAKYPFSGNSLQRISIEDIFTILSESVEVHLAISVKLVGKTPENKYYIKGNTLDIKVLFADWISNMQKYGINPKVEFSVSEKYLDINFYNDTINTELNDIVRIINNPSKSYLTRKKTHGIYTMKEIAEDNDIKLECKISQLRSSLGSNINLLIKFPIYESNEENINY